MAALLIDRSELSKYEKNNILATTNTDDDRYILKDIEIKIKEVDATNDRK